MVVAKLRLAAATLAVSLVAAAFAGGQEDRAADLLRRSMGRRFPVNVVAVILQRDPGGDGTFQRVKVTRSRDGRARHVVLEPLRMAKVESVDDGENMRVYLPDKKALIIQDSPQRMSNDLEERIGLAKKNYQFSVGGRERIAGRGAVCIVADPKDPEMAVRRYYLDEENGYPLKMEVGSDRGRSKVVFDTVAIDYPTSLNQDVFLMSTLPGTETIKYTRPKALTSKTQAQAVVGFRPVMPERLPMGFKVQEMQYNGGKEWKSVVIRLTDGLVRATVYQWQPGDKKIETVEDSSFIDVNGLRLLLVSDLPASIRMRILQSFAGQAKGEEMPRALRLIGMMVPTAPALMRSPELMSTIWTFAQLDDRAGLGDGSPLAGVPYFESLQ